MKRILFILTLLVTLVFSNTYSTEQTTSHIGENATVCGKVVNGYYAQNSSGQPTFLNLDKDYPNQNFTIVIWGSDRYQFNSPEILYIGKKICVTGYIESYKGTAQIVVQSPSQIR